MATNWNAILSNTNNLNDVLSILRKVLAELNVKADFTTIDGALETINNLDTSVQDKLGTLTDEINNFNQEKTDALDDLNAAKEEVLTQVNNITTVNSISDLNNIEKWSGRTVYVKDVANFKWDAADNEWILAGNQSSSIFHKNTTQEEKNDENKSIRDTLAKPYSDYTTAIDCAPFISAYINSFNDGDSITIPKGKWAIKSELKIHKQINIKCDGELVLDGSLNAVFLMKREPILTMTGLDLVNLPKKGDTSLQIKNTALFDSAEHFITLSSTEVEIVRIGYAAPYYKNETLEFIDSSFNFRGQVDLDYTDATKLTISVYKKQKPVNIQLRMSMQPTTGQTTGARILEIEGFNHVIWDVQIDRSNSKLIAGTSFSYKNCVHFTFMPTCRVDGGQSDSSDSYAFLNLQSSYIIHIGVTYFDIGSSTKKERGYAARHGKHVYFDYCFLNGIDDHYGHDYIIKNMDFTNRGISISGGSVWLENCRQLGANHLMQIRGDTPYADGKLVIKNCYGASGLLYAETVYNPAYNSKYKAWDEILISNVESYSDLGYTHALRFSPFYSHNTNFKTKKITLEKIKFKRLANTTARFFNGGASAQFEKIEINGFEFFEDGVDTTKSKLFNGVVAEKSIKLIDLDYVDGEFTSPKIRIRGDGKIGYSLNQPIVFFASSSLIIDGMEITDDCNSYASAAGQGPIYLNLCKINSMKFFDLAAFRDNIESTYGNTVLVTPNFDGDLRNYQKTKPFRHLKTNFMLGTLAVGVASPVQTVAVAGARVGNPIDALFATNANGLRINSWVSAPNEVKYYVENPAANPSGSQTFANIGIIITVRSN